MTTLPQTPSFSLTGKRALVTGASSGIGLGAAAALAQAGAHVTLAARRLETLESLAEAFTAEGWQADALKLDVADVESVRTALDAQDRYDILVNSAGLARHGPSLDTTPEDFSAVADLNLRGAYFISQHIAKRLIDDGKPGSILNITSQMAHVGGIERAVYCATKHGVEGFTKAMAIEWGKHKIRINTLCPTFVRTPFTEPTFNNPERVKWIESKIFLGRVAEIEDLMGAVTFLSSDAAAMITGTSLLVDGGWTAE